MEQRLAHFLKMKVPEAEGLRVNELVRMTEGFSYETFSFRAYWREGEQHICRDFVVRMEPKAGPVPPYDVSRQYRVLKCLEKTPIPAPKVYWLEMDEQVLGKPFFIMEKVEGEVPIPWKTPQKSAYDDPQDREKMARQFVEVLAQLHTLDWEGTGLSFLGAPASPTSYAEQEIQKWERIMEESQLAPYPILVAAFVWLRRNIPPAPRISVVHGDYRLGNFIWRDGRIAAFLDWEMVTLGDPLSDVGWVCMKRVRGKSPLMSALIEKERLFRTYQELTGIRVRDEEVFFWEVLGYAKLGAIEISGLRAIVDGINPDIRLASFEFNLMPLLDELAQMLGF